MRCGWPPPTPGGPGCRRVATSCRGATGGPGSAGGRLRPANGKSASSTGRPDRRKSPPASPSLLPRAALVTAMIVQVLLEWPRSLVSYRWRLASSSRPDSTAVRRGEVRGGFPRGGGHHGRFTGGPARGSAATRGGGSAATAGRWAAGTEQAKLVGLAAQLVAVLVGERGAEGRVRHVAPPFGSDGAGTDGRGKAPSPTSGQY